MPPLECFLLSLRIKDFLFLKEMWEKLANDGLRRYDQKFYSLWAYHKGGPAWSFKAEWYPQRLSTCGAFQANFNGIQPLSAQDSGECLKTKVYEKINSKWSCRIGPLPPAPQSLQRGEEVNFLPSIIINQRPATEYGCSLFEIPSSNPRLSDQLGWWSLIFNWQYNACCIP